MGPRRIPLLEIDPDLVASITTEERRLLAGIWVPTVNLPAEAFDITSLFERHDALGMIVLDGLLMHYLQIGAQPGLRILGTGDVVPARGAPTSELIVGAAWRASSDTSVAILGREFVLGAAHAPRLLVSLGARMAEQTERLTAQLMISQLPRVEDRLLAMLWLLAESFGHVTPAGIAVPSSSRMRFSAASSVPVDRPSASRSGPSPMRARSGMRIGGGCCSNARSSPSPPPPTCTSSGAHGPPGRPLPPHRIRVP